VNPILINPKIESDKSTGEQLQQMKSYLYQFKEQIELLLMNIDTDNVSAKFKEDITDFVGNKIMNGKEMSEIMQSAGMIKLSVADLESSVAAVTITANGVYAQVNGANGILSRLDVDENGIAASVKKGTQYSGITLSGSGVQINSTGTFTVDTTHFTLDSAGNLWCNSGTFEGEVIADEGNIGGLIIHSGYLSYYNKDVIAFSTADCEFGDPNFTHTKIYGSSIELYGSADLGDTVTFDSGRIHWGLLSDLVNNPNARVLCDVVS